jgi:hypothetical protein
MFLQAKKALKKVVRIKRRYFQENLPGKN